MKLTAAAWTSTSTWPGPGTGSAISPSTSASMPSKPRHTIACMSAQLLHANGDDFGGSALHRPLPHAAGHDRLAHTVFDHPRAELQRPLDPRRREVAHVQAGGDDGERRRAAAQVVTCLAAMHRQRCPDRVAVDDRGDRAAIHESRKAYVLGPGMPDTGECLSLIHISEPTRQ